MNRANRWPEVAAMMAVTAVLGAAVAVGGQALGNGLDGRPLHAHSHGRLSVPLGLGSPGTPAEPGYTVPGAGIVTHFQEGREAETIDGTGGGRMIYTGIKAFEPTLGIDKEGNIFYQGLDRFGAGIPSVVVSRHDGRSWDDVTPTLHTHSQDPFLYVDDDTGRAFAADLTFPCTTVSHTDDVGELWITSQACMLADHQSVFAGPPVSSPTVGYPNIVYLCAIDLGAATAPAETSCLKSLDGGVAWVRTGAPAYMMDPANDKLCDGASGHGFVDAEGTVYLPRGWCGQPYLAISRDEGASWERILVADTEMEGPFQGLCVNFCIDTFDHESAVAVDAKGNIYYLWMGSDRLPYLAVSRDNGKSFSKPMMIGPPGLKAAWGPTMDVGATGKIALAYLGSTNAPDREPNSEAPAYTEGVGWNGYITTSVNASSKRPRFFTASVNHPSDPIVGGECRRVRCWGQGDFIDIVIDRNGRPWTAMADACWPAPGTVCGSSGGMGFVGTVFGMPKLR